MLKIKYNTGYTTLITTLIVFMVVVSITILLLQNNFNVIDNSLLLQNSYQAKYLSESCIEKALQEIRDSTSYTGNDTINIGNGTCTFTVTNEGGQNRRIQAEAVLDNTVKKVLVEIDKINPEINITSYKEVADY